MNLPVVLIYLAVIAFVVWQVVSALKRISNAVEDIASTLRRMESKEQTPMFGSLKS